MTSSILISLLVIFSPMLISAAPLTENASDCVCKDKDSLEEPQKFKFGQFSGSCIDSCHFRRARILSSDLPKEISVGNILNYGVFYSGGVPIQNFTKIEMGFENFLPGINHIFLRFQMDPNADPIRLHDQTGRSHKVVETRTLVLSSEAVPPKGHRYEMLESYFGNYLIVTRIATGEEVERWTKDLKHPVKLIELKLSPEQISKILVNGIQDSDANGLKEIYKLFTNNCSTRALSFIDEEIGHKRSQSLFNWKEFEEALPLTGPIGTIRALQARNLIKN